jgi:hypothetical protein
MLAVLGILLFAGLPLEAQNISAKDEMVVLVFSNYPKKSSSLFINELKAQLSNMQEGSAFALDLLYTMGDEKTADQLVKELQSREVLLCVYLDLGSARLIAPRIATPGLILIPSARFLDMKKDGLLLGLSDRTAVLETQPTLKHFVAAAQRVTPPPPRLGLVDTRYNTQEGALIKELRKIWPEEILSEDSAPISVCAPNGAACENLNAMRHTLQKDLAELEKGSLLLVMPDTNTLKFAFAIRQFSEKQQLGLIGFGDFHPGGELLRISYTTQQLASVCSDTILTYARNPEGKPQLAERPAPQVSFDPQIGKALGYYFTKLPAPQNNKSRGNIPK